MALSARRLCLITQCLVESRPVGETARGDARVPGMHNCVHYWPNQPLCCQTNFPFMSWALTIPQKRLLYFLATACRGLFPPLKTAKAAFVGPAGAFQLPAGRRCPEVEVPLPPRAQHQAPRRAHGPGEHSRRGRCPRRSEPCAVGYTPTPTGGSEVLRAGKWVSLTTWKGK